MIYKPRYYQTEAIDAGVNFFQQEERYNGVLVLPTGSGKSVVVANTTSALSGNTVVFQPSKEILEQNFAKYTSYGYRASIYSASLSSKHIDKVTFATIGSVATKHHLFRQFSNIIIDECHTVNASQGMYRDFFNSNKQAKILGLTATPYRLTSDFDGSKLEFITRTEPKVFSKVLYYIQNDVLFNAGYLAPLEYYQFNVVDRSMLTTTANGADFTAASVSSYYRQIGMVGKVIAKANAILTKRKNLLVFCSLISEAVEVAKGIPGAVVLTGETDTDVRSKMLKAFQSGKIRCLVNVGVLTTGFDYPALEAILIARSTMSLALWYQMVGRVMRPFTYPDGTKKIGWVVDMGGNLPLFGKIETMRIETTRTGLHYVSNNGRQLTDISFSKN